ncbi:MAG: helix-turn-helix domain-containing protein [Candidatus Babeliales bacterium]
MKNKFFKDLKVGLEDVIAHKKGKLNLRSDIIEVPEPPSEYKPHQIKKIRITQRYSQGIFAKILNVSIKTVQSWESGQRSPSHAALRLLEIIEKGIYKPDIYKRN